MALPEGGSFLSGIRVLELGDELGEYCGKVLAGLGADVVKIEPPDGESTREYGPFLDDEPHPDRSLYFWHYNFGKRGIVLDLDDADGQERFRELAAGADVVLETRAPGFFGERGIGYESFAEMNPGLIWARITPFGDDGPWAGLVGSDLVHLALGGVVMNCGYDPDPHGHYDTPPIAPQMWHAYHVAGEHSALGILAALLHRLETGNGQHVSVAVHQAVAANTETDVPDWVYQRRPHQRQTCRHSLAHLSLPALARTKDGRWLLPYRTYLRPGLATDPFPGTARLLQRNGLGPDLGDPKYQDPRTRTDADNLYVSALIDMLVGRTMYADDVWRDAQTEGLTWAPCRLPEENLDEEHWTHRETFIDVEHPELGRTFRYVGAKWFAPGVPWRRGPRAPLLGEHTSDVLNGSAPATPRTAGEGREQRASARGLPFALSGVRVVDLSWLLASGGAGRFLAALGAEVIKVEHESRPDAMRFGAAIVPEGDRPARDAAREPISTSIPSNPNRCGAFMEINPGKLSLSLNLKSERGKELLTELLRDADIVVEGYSPGTMARMGFGYERLREINPRLVYVQQSGMGEAGTYGRLRSYGPTAQAMTGLSEMSGLPEPYPPAGFGYSYLDWFGAYNMALAMLAGLHRQRVTGEGCYIDSSQAEAGIYLTGTAILDAVANGRRWERIGNRSPYKRAAPHGIYPALGDDRWLAIACFTEEHWHALGAVLGAPEWAADTRFATLSGRLEHAEELDRLVGEETRRYDRFDLMASLQAAGVPSGVCQDAEDRCDRDPQLAHLGWLVELPQSEVGTWPTREMPAHLARTPPYIGGLLGRHAPSYGEDADYVLGELLGLGAQERESLSRDGVV